MMNIAPSRSARRHDDDQQDRHTVIPPYEQLARTHFSRSQQQSGVTAKQTVNFPHLQCPFAYTKRCN